MIQASYTVLWQLLLRLAPWLDCWVDVQADSQSYAFPILFPNTLGFLVIKQLVSDRNPLGKGNLAFGWL